MFNNKFSGKKLEKKHKINKNFDYKKNTANLNFTLDIENKEAMRDFVEILKEALTEVENQIKELE